MLSFGDRFIYVTFSDENLQYLSISNVALNGQFKCYFQMLLLLNFKVLSISIFNTEYINLSTMIFRRREVFLKLLLDIFQCL